MMRSRIVIITEVVLVGLTGSNNAGTMDYFSL